MKKILLFTLIIIIIPILIVGLDGVTDIISKIKYGSYSNKVIKVKRNSTGNIEEVPLEDYVVGVVAGEMPASFNIEALKSQAVASRTYVLKKTENNKKNYDVEDSTSNQVYIDDAQLKEKWQGNYESNLKKVKEAVSATKGEVILYRNTIIDAMFFSTSNGYTENSEDVFSSNEPYLVSVSSSWDEKESPVFSSTNEFSKKNFLFNLGLDTNSEIKISNIKKTKTGRVKSIMINQKEFTSNEIRKAFSLRSTSFSIEQTSEKIIFHVNGFGHGVGMSQYGANGMAKAGYKYQDILKHYYKDCDIKKIN